MDESTLSTPIHNTIQGLCAKRVTDEPSTTGQSGQFVEIEFEAHASFLMIRLILGAFHRMADELAGDVRGLGQRTASHHRIPQQLGRAAWRDSDVCLG